MTGNDTDPGYVKDSGGKQGTLNPALGLMWRINGVAFLSKGANMIPMDEMEGARPGPFNVTPGVQSDFVWLPARTPHGGAPYVR